MIVYEAEKRDFLRHCDDEEIEELILDRFIQTEGHRVAAAEVCSWRESLREMARVLRDDDIPGTAGVAVELHIPQSSKRIDVTLSGFDSEGRKNAIIVELKQWEAAVATEKDAIVRTWVGGTHREMVHPSYQAWSYAALLENFNEAVYSGDIVLKPCAYLHNYNPDGVIDSPRYRDHIERAPVFLRGREDRQRLREFIKKAVRTGDSGAVLAEIA